MVNKAHLNFSFLSSQHEILMGACTRACCCVPDRLPVHVPQERYTVSTEPASDTSSTELVKNESSSQERNSYTEERIDIDCVS